MITITLVETKNHLEIEARGHSMGTDEPCARVCFGTIRNNTALKHGEAPSSYSTSFGTIRNNTALKPRSQDMKQAKSFGTIRNNTALKLGINQQR